MQMTASFFCRGLTPPPRWAGRRLSRPSLRWGLIDAFFKKAWQKSRMQSHQICHDWLGALLTV